MLRISLTRLGIPSSRSLSVGIVHGLDNIAASMTLKVFPTLVDWLGFSGTNFFYSGSCMILTLWGRITIKETDGLSLAEVERIYDHKHRYQEYGGKKEGSHDHHGQRLF